MNRNSQTIKSVKDADVAGKRVLMRATFNVPIEHGAVVDDTRIRAVLPTLTLLLEGGALHIILLTHLGRPGGKMVEGLSVAPVCARLDELLSQNLASQKSPAAPRLFVQQGFAAYEISEQITLLENLRFDPGEEANDAAFAKKLAALGDIYVNDAFADSHRSHASIVGLPKLLPSYAGLLLEQEIVQLTQALTPPQHSLAIIGGAKFETKLPLIEKFAQAYSRVVVGGAIANDLLRSRGLPVGASLVSDTPVPVALAENQRVTLPRDLTVELDESRVAHTADVRVDERIVDIGPHTAVVWSDEIKKAGFVLWNGTMGVCEKGYCSGTEALAQALVDSGCRAVLGGGDTLAATKKFAFDPRRIFVSTGGGAMLQFLADGTLPGIEALKK